MNKVPWMTVASAIAGAVLSVAVIADPPPASYRGLRVPPMPAGYEEVGGYLVNVDAPVEYAVVEIHAGGRKMWWLKKMLARDKQGVPHWEVVDAMPVPAIPRGYHFVLGACEKDGESNPEIIAAAKSEDREMLNTIHGAWIANLRSQRLEPYPTRGVVCVNEGFGV